SAGSQRDRRDWRSGSALPSHGRGHWFDPSIAHSGVIRTRRETGGNSRTACTAGAIGAAVARFPDTEEVTGSIPVSRTDGAGGRGSGPRLLAFTPSPSRRRAPHGWR